MLCFKTPIKDNLRVLVKLFEPPKIGGRDKRALGLRVLSVGNSNKDSIGDFPGVAQV